MSEKQKIPAQFIKLDLDHHITRVGEGAFLGGRNYILYDGPDGRSGVPRKFRGTKEIPCAAPSGDNKAIGSYWDEKGDTMLMFVWNSTGQHWVIRHFPGEPQSRVVVIPQLNLSADKPVAGCALVNGEILCITDGGDYPKMFNILRADDTNKKAAMRLYLPQSGVLVDYRMFTAQATLGGSPAGPLVQNPILSNATTQQVRDFRPMVSQLADNWNSSPLAAFFTAHGCSDYIELEAVAAGDYSVNVTSEDVVGGVPLGQLPCIAEYTNRYNSPFTFPQLRMSRFKPLLPPEVETGYDESVKSSLTRERMLQFAYGYRLRDHEVSRTSPVSRIPLSASSPCGGAGTVPNYITVAFPDDKWLTDPSTRGEVETIDIYARDGNNGAWRLVKSLDKYEWIYSRSWRFYNDSASAPADEAFVEAATTYVPPVANALEVFEDTFDNNHLILGGITEGDPNPCVEVGVAVEIGTIDAVEQSASVVFEVVFRGFQDPFKGYPWGSPYDRNQAVLTYDGTKVVFGGMAFAINGHDGNPELLGQELPLGGVLVYAKGTDRRGISIQNMPVASLPCGTNSPTPWQPPQNHPAIGRGVYDATQTGTALLNNCNDTHRAAIRRALENDSVRSTVRIDGLIPGETYVFCLGDFGVTLEDLNTTGLEWQRRSGAALQMGSVNSATIKSERDQCTVTIPVGAGGTVINCGTIDVADVTNPGILDGSIKIDGFVIDDMGTDYSASHDIRVLGVSAERQAVVVQRYVTGSWAGGFGGTATTPWAWVNDMFASGVAPTNHNGYFCFFGPSFPTGSARAAVLGVTGDPGNPSGTITGFTGSSVTVTAFQVLNDINDSKWEGDITGPLVANPTAPNLIGNRWQRYIFANLNPSVSLRTHIRGRVVDSSGTPMEGIGAILEGGRYTQTEADGTINLVAMGDAYQNQDKRVVDRLIWYAKGPCRIEMPSGGKIQNIFIDPFWAGNPFSEAPDTAPYPNHLILADRVAVITSLAGRSCLSRGGAYPFGYILYRYDGSGTAVKWVADVKIPNLGQNLVDYDPLAYPATTYPNGLWLTGPASLRWTISGAVPEAWIGEYEVIQFVMGGDATKDFQLQWVAGQVTYASRFKTDTSEPEDVGYGNASATEIYIVLSDSLERMRAVNTGFMPGYQWQRGDMVRILSDRFGNPLQEVVEAPLEGQRNGIGQVGKWIVLKASSSIPRLYGGEAIEIFTPAARAEGPEGSTYYAIPSAAVEILDPYGTPAWSQTTGLVENGDTHLIPTSVPFQSSLSNPWTTIPWTRESRSASDYFSSESWDRGKAYFVDPDATTEKRGQLMRYSDPYKPGTNINGLNVFQGLNFREAENWLGPIRWMGSVEDVIVCVCEAGSFSIYKGVQRTEAGINNELQIAGKILGSIRNFAHRHGTLHPLSVQRGTTSLLFYDRNNGCLVQYASAALLDLSLQEDCSTYFRNVSRHIAPDTNVCSGWDMVHGEFLFTFGRHFWDDGYESRLQPGETIKYYDHGNAFTCHLDANPDCWGRTRLRLYSFIGGVLWQHNATDRWNEVYGNNVGLSIRVPFKAGVNTRSTDLWIRAKGDNWTAPTIYNDEGQQTSIDSFKRSELYMTKAIGKDQDGRQMRGAEIVVELLHDRNGYAELVEAYLGPVVSPNVPST